MFDWVRPFLFRTLIVVIIIIAFGGAGGALFFHGLMANMFHDIHTLLFGNGSGPSLPTIHK